MRLTYMLKLIDTSCKVQAALILLKLHQHGIRSSGVKEISFYNKISLHRPWSVKQKIAAMTSIFVRSEYHLEGTSNFNTWKEMVLDILEDSYISTMIEVSSSNAGRIQNKTYAPFLSLFLVRNFLEHFISNHED